MKINTGSESGVSTYLIITKGCWIKLHCVALTVFVVEAAIHTLRKKRLHKHWLDWYGLICCGIHSHVFWRVSEVSYALLRLLKRDYFECV